MKYGKVVLVVVTVVLVVVVVVVVLVEVVRGSSPVILKYANVAVNCEPPG